MFGYIPELISVIYQCMNVSTQTMEVILLELANRLRTIILLATQQFQFLLRHLANRSGLVP